MTDFRVRTSPGPDPDETVFLFNTVYERQTDGTWMGHIEALAGGNLICAVHDSDAMAAKLALGRALAAVIDSLDDTGVARLRAKYAVERRWRDVPSVQWPPVGSSWRLLEFPPPATVN